MNLLRFIRATLFYFKGVNLAVILGVAIATGVLSGALMVGDSVRASLADLAVQRLGKIDHALISPRFFNASLAKRIAEEQQIAGKLSIGAAVITRGGAALDSSQGHTAGVQIIGADAHWVPIDPGKVTLNSQTAEALGLTVTGADVVLSLPSESDIPREATLAQRSRQQTLAGMRARVSSIVSEPGMLSLFTPGSGQRAPQNAWVNLADLQNAIGRAGQINTLFASEVSAVAEGAQTLNQALKRVLTVSDYSLQVSSVSRGEEIAITSTNTYIPGPIEMVADQLAQQRGIRLNKVSVNLLNKVTHVSADGSDAQNIHYAVAAGITALNGEALAEDEVAINEWTASQLDAKLGDRLAMTFYRRQLDGSLIETNAADRGLTAHLRIVKILPMSGIGADSSLTPSYKGLTDATSIASWNPPAEVKIDKSLVTAADEEYWKAHKGAPKIFVSFDTARRLWGTGFGDATSLRLPAQGSQAFINALVDTIDPATLGLMFRPLRQEQISAASGPTDFGQLFIAFSFFLIFAAVLLVAMLMRLGVEQRARQLGILSAIGFSPRQLRRMALAEGMLLSVIGGVLGSAIAVGYSWLMIAGLRTWWLGAIGTTSMQLHVFPMTLIIGFFISQIVATLAIIWAVRQVGAAAPAQLLAGGWESASPTRRSAGAIARWIGMAGLIAGLLIISVGAFEFISAATAFLAGGAVLLSSSLCLLGGLLRVDRNSSGTAIRSLLQLSIRNAKRHAARSVLSIGLIALAAYALVTVAAMRQGEPTDTGEARSGSGGFRLIVDADIPLFGNPATLAGRELLGFREPSAAIWNRVELLPLRRRAGDDLSCLNITRPTNPTITAIPDALIERNAFRFASVPRSVERPWELLRSSDPSGDIPVITDANTATYILHINVGDTVTVTDDAGVPRRLRLVATLSGSIFQAELLMGEVNFRNLFPSQSGFKAVLVKTYPGDQDDVRRLLSDDLADYAASVRSTASVMAGYLQVQNTYLSTFQLLGALGLMLGTIGLAVVLVRTVVERRAELALFAALGYSTATRLRLVLMENLLLLITGLLLGTFCALVGVLPALRDSSRTLNYRSLALTLSITLATGLCASGLAVVLSGRDASPARLRRE